MFGFLFSWFIGQWWRKIRCTKTQTRPNSRIPHTSATHKDIDCTCTVDQCLSGSWQCAVNWGSVLELCLKVNPLPLACNFRLMIMIIVCIKCSVVTAALAQLKCYREIGEWHPMALFNLSHSTIPTNYIIGRYIIISFECLLIQLLHHSYQKMIIICKSYRYHYPQ